MSDSNTVKAPTRKWTALLISALEYSQLNFSVTKITILLSDQLQLQNFDFIVNFVINKVVKFIINASIIYSSDVFQSIYFLDHLNERFFFFL